MTGPAAVLNGYRYWRWAVTTHRHFATLPNLVTTRTAADEVHVTTDRIRQWAHRGILTRYGRVNGRAYYDIADVHRVAAVMRTQADTQDILARMLDDHRVTPHSDPEPD